MRNDNAYRIRLTEKAASITGKRYCTACRHYQPTEGGEMIKTSNGKHRWKCVICLEVGRARKLNHRR